MASNLVVLSFEGADTARGMLDNIRDMQARGARIRRGRGVGQGLPPPTGG